MHSRNPPPIRNSAYPPSCSYGFVRPMSVQLYKQACPSAQPLAGLFVSHLQCFLLPSSKPIENGTDDCAHDPGYQQRDEHALLTAVRKFRRAGQECDSVSNRNTDHDGRDNRNPHRRHGVTGAAHGSLQALRHRHGDIADSQNAHHPAAQIYQ